MSLAFCTGLYNIILSTLGMEKDHPDRYPMNRPDYLKVYKKIDRFCGYDKSYFSDFENERNFGALPHSSNVIAYQRNKSQENLRKMENPIHYKACSKLIKFHTQDVKNNL